MADIGAGSAVGDSAVVSAPGWEDNTRAEITAKMPLCPTCKVQMGPYKKWGNPKLYPPIRCNNDACADHGRVLNPRAWRDV